MLDTKPPVVRYYEGGTYNVIDRDRAPQVSEGVFDFEAKLGKIELECSEDVAADTAVCLKSAFVRPPIFHKRSANELGRVRITAFGWQLPDGHFGARKMLAREQELELTTK